MSRAAKGKTPAILSPRRKPALSAPAAARRPFPAWIADDESGVAFPARAAAMPRVRDGLVLHRVSRKKTPGKKSGGAKGSTDGHGAR